MTHETRKSKLRYLFYLLLIIGLGGGAYLCYDAIVGDEEAAVSPHREKKLSQKRHLPAGHWLLRSEDIARIPFIDGFQSPLGTEAAAFTYDAQPYGELNNKRGGRHVGSDLNGIGGADTDMSMPIYAAARGLVVYSGTPSADWGKVLILAHSLPDGRIIQSLYAHLADSVVGVGQMVARGEVIGTLGSAEGIYYAHLHFELIESLAIEAGRRAYHPAHTMNRCDPQQLIAQYPAPAHPDAYLQVRRLFLQEARSSSPAPSLPEGSIPVNPNQFLPITP